MKKLLVKDWMTAEVLSAGESTKLMEAHRMMKSQNVRRLPVLRGRQLLGIVTLGDVRQAMPSDVTSLSVFEINYLLDQVTVSGIMTRNLITVSPDTTIKEAANLMLENKIGGLPVVDAGDDLIGIITESDIFRIVAAEPLEE